MFTHFSATSIRASRFGVKWGVKRPFLAQYIESEISRYYANKPQIKDENVVFIVKTKVTESLETTYNKPVLLGFCHASPKRISIKVKYIKNAILESNFEQMYHDCIENLQLIDNQRS